jgi:hypothetical protein
MMKDVEGKGCWLMIGLILLWLLMVFDDYRIVFFRL